ncbi:MAG TPA: GntG family PLP-dependent aldolase [Alphaproteobacteria bacterium]|nr:GntG family PLP-dependent aldolase [Alphaproteobacteria bacterium]
MTAIDLRSDTVTMPTERMRERMRDAELGDDSRDGDPTVRALEALAAARTGKEAAVFVPSGTMANLVALLAHTGRGGEVLFDAECHIARSEMGGIAGLAGLFHRPLPAARGAIELAALEEAIGTGLTPNRLGTALVTMETSHNAAGGAVLPLAHMAAVARLARARGIPVHIDGARLFNAAVALGVGAERIAANGDSVCFCISKGLSAPIGSLLCGSTAFIERARGFRRMAGGNLRQAGTVAAAGIVALEEMIERLAEDHARAKRLAQGLHAVDPSLVAAGEVETNIVMVEVASSRRTAAEWSQALAEQQVLASPARRDRLRLVTHRHIGDGEVDRAVAAFGQVWRRFVN